MQVVRTIVWVLLLVALLLFSYANWEPTVTVRIWDGIVVDTKIPAIVIISFFVGFVPMWLLYRAHRWTASRRIASLENAARTVAATPVAVAPQPAAEPAPPPAPEPGSVPVPDVAPVPQPEPETPLHSGDDAADTRTDNNGEEPGPRL